MPEEILKKVKVFIIRPWHNPRASLYPYIMDGVEYVEAVIRAIKTILDKDKFDVRVDEDVFIPGFTIRDNLEKELPTADLVLVILDGLRPNVVYELGVAYGLKNSKIVCLADKDATVLVRNYYHNPMAIPTTKGENVIIYNPPLNMSTAFSDNADLLMLIYSRLDLERTLKNGLKYYIDEIIPEESKNNIVEEAIKDEAASDDENNSSEISNYWELYKLGKFDQIIDDIGSSKSYSHKKLVALSLMKLGRIYEAIKLWQEMNLASKDNKEAILFHLGVCYYVIGQFETALNYLQQACTDNKESERTKIWIDRVNAKLARVSSTTCKPDEDKST